MSQAGWLAESDVMAGAARGAGSLLSGRSGMVALKQGLGTLVACDIGRNINAKWLSWGNLGFGAGISFGEAAVAGLSGAGIEALMHSGSLMKNLKAGVEVGVADIIGNALAMNTGLYQGGANYVYAF